MAELQVIEDNGRKDVVELLDDMLQRAKEGEIHSIAVCGILTGNRVITVFQTASDGDKFALLGSIGYLGHRLMGVLDRHP